MQLFLATCIPFSISSQNLVPNPDFEAYSACPTWLNGGGNPLECTPWGSGNSGSPDYFHVCATASVCSVPNNVHGYQEALSGEAYVGIAVRNYNSDYREYILAQLLEPLQSGTAYWVSFYVNLGDIECGIQRIGALFTSSPPEYMFSNPLEYGPQIESNLGYISDSENWTLIEGCFLPLGGEQYITIGNYHDNEGTPLDPDCTTGSLNSYYYIEDISVEPMVPTFFPLELGGPVVACYSYEIDPGYSDAYYYWSNGTNSPTLIVTESGTYSVTVGYDCSFGVDEIEVTILQSYPIDLGIEQLVLCEGDSYTISLDPSVGEYLWQDGSTNHEYIISSGGIFAVTLDDGCEITSDQIVVTMLAPPESFNLGGELYLCPGAQIDYFFDPALGQFIWQDGSTSSSYAITEEGSYALTISNMCGAASDVVLVTATDPPALNLPYDIYPICDNSPIEFDFDPAMGEYLWQDGSTSAFYFVSTPGIYSVTVTNFCGTDMHTMDVQAFDTPQVDLGGDTLLCIGDTLHLSGDSVTGMYWWQDSSSNSFFDVILPGEYSLTVSNPCGTGYDIIVVDYESMISPPDLGPDIISCVSDPVILYSGNPGANFIWSDQSTSDSLVVTTSGDYFLTVFNNCVLYADTIAVSFIDNLPPINLPDQVSLCQGQSLLLDPGVTGVTYVWSDGSQQSNLEVNTPGTYSLTITSSCGMAIDTTLILDGGPPPYVSLGNAIDLCQGDTILLNPEFLNVDFWLWSDGSTGSAYSITDAGWVGVTVTNDCSEIYDSLLVSFMPPIPTLDLGADTALCPGGSITLTVPFSGGNVVWSDGSALSDIVVHQPGTYSVSITNNCGTSSDTIQVHLLPDAPLLDLGPDQPLCPGETITINPGITGVNYLWQDGSTATYNSSTQAGTIILTLSNACGFATDTLEIFESTNGPQIDLGEDILACEGETITLASNISGVNYLWQDGSTNAQFITSQSGTFILQVSNLCGSDADTIMVDISGLAPHPVLGVDTSICDDNILLLNSVADAETTIAWQDGSSSPVFTVSSPGIYILSESNRCGEVSDTIIVSYASSPEIFDLGQDTVLCPGEFMVLYAPDSPYDFLWQNGSHQPSIIADQAIIYSLQISNMCGTVSDSLSVAFDTRIPVMAFPDTILLCNGTLITLDATQSFAADYYWNTGSTSSVIETSIPGMYSIEISTPCHTLSQEVDVRIANCDQKNDIYVPTIFSPNGDHINDVFTLYFHSDLEVQSMSGAVYDRWGNQVFASRVIPFEWDGRFQNRDLMPGVFVYYIKINYLMDGKPHEQILTGDIMLIR